MDVFEEVSRAYAAWNGEKCIFGRSVQGRPLYAFFAGENAFPVGICQAAMHAREWVTAYLVLGQLARGVRRGGVWFLPLVNPDGALLSQCGADTMDMVRRESVLRLSDGQPLSLWKANAEGVDLNVNFPARWGTGKTNVRTPAPANYIGHAPLCAPESRALAAFTLRVRPAFTVSYHTKGEEIYWRFHQPPRRLARDLRLAKLLRSATGYPLKEAPMSAGGYKDWCIRALKIPAFTVEVGREEGEHPLGKAELFDIFKKNLDSIERLTEGI